MTAAGTILITGANRGLGLGLARAFLARGWRVLAACRRPDAAADLAGLRSEHPDSLTLHPLDVTEPRSVDALAAALTVEPAKLDVLVNNAGIHPGERTEGVDRLDVAAVERALAVNVLGPLRVTQALLPLLRAGQRPRVVNVSSGAGSLRASLTRAHPGYAISKAALNMFTRRAAAELRAAGITVVSVSPGWVRTDMGGPGADLSVAEATAALATTIEHLEPDRTGQWLDRFGQPSEFAW
jgi:NAD(P)-dependent dehydrogenase (short-subunit alcohol dehydrogenase family)